MAMQEGVMYMYPKTIKMNKDTVVKRDHPDLMRIEVEKTIRAYKIGQECGLFRVPRVLDYNDDKGLVVLERIHRAKGVRDLIAFGRIDESLIETFGKAIAIIHKDLVLPSEMRISLPFELALNQNEVFLHGDLSVDNVCVVDSKPPIVILDWQMTLIYGGKATYGTCYYDLAFFINTMFIRPIPCYWSCLSADSAATKFMQSYASTMSDFDAKEFKRYVKLFFQQVLIYRTNIMTWKRRISMIPCHYLFRRWIETVGRDDLKVK